MAPVGHRIAGMGLPPVQSPVPGVKGKKAAVPCPPAHSWGRRKPGTGMAPRSPRPGRRTTAPRSSRSALERVRFRLFPASSQARPAAAAPAGPEPGARKSGPRVGAPGAWPCPPTRAAWPPWEPRVSSWTPPPKGSCPAHPLPGGSAGRGPSPPGAAGEWSPGTAAGLPPAGAERRLPALPWTSSPGRTSPGARSCHGFCFRPKFCI